jgi:hypothetical protein
VIVLIVIVIALFFNKYTGTEERMSANEYFGISSDHRGGADRKRPEASGDEGNRLEDGRISTSMRFDRMERRFERLSITTATAVR